MINDYATIKDLMIDNYVLSKWTEESEYEPAIIDYLQRTGFSTSDKLGVLYLINYNNVGSVGIKPIKLTESILTAFGFKKTANSNTHYSLGSFNFLFFKMGCPIKYLHQLQSFYRLTTGKSLVCDKALLIDALKED